jgi:recombinational DNA repair ATPase RecF
MDLFGHELVSWRNAMLTWRNAMLTWRNAMLTWRNAMLTWRNAMLTWRNAMLTWRNAMLTDAHGALSNAHGLVLGGHEALTTRAIGPRTVDQGRIALRLVEALSSSTHRWQPRSQPAHPPICRRSPESHFESNTPSTRIE